MTSSPPVPQKIPRNSGHLLKAKDKKAEASGVAPLRNTDGLITIDPQARANILNEQFKSVFTTEDTSQAPDKGPSPFSTMNSISINPRGV